MPRTPEQNREYQRRYRSKRAGEPLAGEALAAGIREEGEEGTPATAMVPVAPVVVSPACPDCGHGMHLHARALLGCGSMDGGRHGQRRCPCDRIPQDGLGMQASEWSRLVQSLDQHQRDAILGAMPLAKSRG